MEGIIGFRGEDDNIGENHVPTARPDAGGAALTLLRNSRPNFTSDGVHLEGIIDDNIGETHVSTARPNAGGAALKLLRDSRPHFTAITKEVGDQSEDGSRNGETEDKIGQ